MEKSHFTEEQTVAILLEADKVTAFLGRGFSSCYYNRDYVAHERISQ